MGRRRRCGPDRAADREDELSESARRSRDERLGRASVGHSGHQMSGPIFGLNEAAIAAEADASG